MNIGGLKSMLYEKDEVVISVLGQSFVSSVTSGDIGSSVMFATTKRLYQKGRIYEKEGGTWISRSGSKTVNIRDITGTGFTTAFRLWTKIIGMLFGVFGLMLVVAASMKPNNIDLPWVLITGIVLAISFWLLFRTTTRLFVVEYAGGYIGTRSDWYSKKEIEVFQRAVILQKEKILASESRSAIEIQSSPASNNQKAADELDPATKWECRNCGATNADGLNECYNCGHASPSSPQEWLNSSAAEDAFFAVLEYQGIEKARSLYQNIKESSKKVVFQQSRLDEFAFDEMKKGHFDLALSLFRLNIDAFPGNAICYASLARAYESLDHDDDAETSYKKALEVLVTDHDNPEEVRRSLLNTVRSRLKHLSEKSETHHCPTCHKENSRDSKFCIFCGAHLSQPTVEQ